MCCFIDCSRFAVTVASIWGFATFVVAGGYPAKYVVKAFAANRWPPLYATLLDPSFVIIDTRHIAYGFVLFSTTFCVLVSLYAIVLVVGVRTSVAATALFHRDRESGSIDLFEADVLSTCCCRRRDRGNNNEDDELRLGRDADCVCPRHNSTMDALSVAWFGTGYKLARFLLPRSW